MFHIGFIAEGNERNQRASFQNRQTSFQTPRRSRAAPGRSRGHALVIAKILDERHAWEHKANCPTAAADKLETVSKKKSRVSQIQTQLIRLRNLQSWRIQMKN